MAVRWRSGDPSGIISSDASLYLRCSVVAAGERAYEAALSGALPDDTGDEAGELLLGVAKDAFAASADGELEASVSVETGANLAAWASEDPQCRPSPLKAAPVSSRPVSASVAGPFSHHAQLVVANLVTFEPGAVFGYRGLMTRGSEVREVIGVLRAARDDEAHTAAMTSLLAVAAAGGYRLQHPIEIYATHWTLPSNRLPIFVIRRRSKLSQQQYVDWYFRGDRV